MDLYIHNEYGLCIGAFGFILAAQKGPSDKQVLATIAGVRGKPKLKKLYSIRGISTMQPREKIPLTTDMLKMTADDILATLVFLARAGKRNNVEIITGYDVDLF